MYLRNRVFLVVKKQDVSKAKALCSNYGAVYPLSQRDIQIGQTDFVVYSWEIPKEYEQALLCDCAVTDVPDFYAITGMTDYDFQMVHIKQGDIYFTHECDQLGTPLLAIRLDRQLSYDAAASFIAAGEMIENFFSIKEPHSLCTHLRI